MSRRTALAAILLLFAAVLVALARRDSPARPERVAPPSADTPPAPRDAAITETSADPSARASIAEHVPRVAPGLSVSGTVRDLKSTLAGATVALWLDEKGSDTPLAKVETGADGAFSFPVTAARPYFLSCTAPEHDEASAVAQPGEPVELYLASRGATIELYGRVQTPEGRPVTSFSLCVATRSGKTLFPSKPQQSPTGEFRIRVGLRSESSSLEVGASAAGFDAGAKQIADAREGSSIDVGAIELKPLRKALAGIVLDAVSRQPVAHAHLELLCTPAGRQRDVESAADGTFELSALPAQVPEAVSVWAHGYSPRVIELAGPAVPMVDGRLLVELGPGATIHGFVECVGDAKPGELNVVCWEQQCRKHGPSDSPHLRGIARVGSTGEYELEHIAPAPLYVGLYREVRGSGQREIYSSQVQTLWPKEGARCELDFRVGSLPRIRVPIRANEKGFAVVGRLFDASGTLVSSTETLSGGDLIFPDVARGRYEIRVCTVDVEHYLAQPVDVGREDVELPEWDITAMPRSR
jgi:hypothetical protein